MILLPDSGGRCGRRGWDSAGGLEEVEEEKKKEKEEESEEEEEEGIEEGGIGKGEGV